MQAKLAPTIHAPQAKVTRMRRAVIPDLGLAGLLRSRPTITCRGQPRRPRCLRRRRAGLVRLPGPALGHQPGRCAYPAQGAVLITLRPWSQCPFRYPIKVTECLGFFGSGGTGLPVAADLITKAPGGQQTS